MSVSTILEMVKAKASSVSPMGKTLKLDLGGEHIFIDGTGDSNTVSSEDKDADCTIKISAENFKALVAGDLNPMTAMMTGKIKVSGDMGVAMKLQSLIG